MVPKKSKDTKGYTASSRETAAIKFLAIPSRGVPCIYKLYVYIILFFPQTSGSIQYILFSTCLFHLTIYYYFGAFSPVGAYRAARIVFH